MVHIATYCWLAKKIILQVTGLDVGDRYLWCKSYMMYDSHGFEWIAGLRTCICSGGAWIDWCTLAYTKGKPNQKLQHVLRGEYGQQYGQYYLGTPFALDVKGGE